MSWARIIGGILAAVVVLIIADLNGALRRERPIPVAVPSKPAQVAEVKPTFRPNDESPEDLPPGPGREETFYFCTACHGTAVIKAQGMRREQWDESLTWMQAKHNMPKPDAATREVLLGYLGTALPPKVQRGWVSPFQGR